MQVLVNTEELSDAARAEVEAIADKRAKASRRRAKQLRSIRTGERGPTNGGGVNDAKKLVPRVGSDPIADGKRERKPMQSGAEVRLAE